MRGSPSSPIQPGATLGVLGGGQLGRMFAIAARRMGYRVHVYSPTAGAPAGQSADLATQAAYDDLDAVRRFARTVDAVTFEFENVPANTAAAVAECTIVRPSGDLLHTAQHRSREKTALSSAGFPVTPFAIVRTASELASAVIRFDGQAVLKTASMGYDGKGQRVVRAADDTATCWAAMDVDEGVAEALVDFERELSVVAARGVDGSIADYGVIENAHANHILDTSIWPASVSPGTEAHAVDIARSLMTAWDVVGVLCVEFFLTRDGELLINEIAPRPHNSGHLTIDAAATCQFEQQVRAVCGLPLGSTARLSQAAMANLLGDLWSPATPDFAAALGQDRVKLHLYGKRQARPGRKMGHLTALADHAHAALATVTAARAAMRVAS